MANCPNCGNPLKEGSKFCGSCGKPVAGGATCPHCGQPMKPGSKFCGYCGKPIGAPAAAPAAGAAGGNAGAQRGNEPAQVAGNGFLRWTMLPGQLAVRISEKDIEACNEPRVAKGIVIQRGTRALFFVNGKIVAELGAGSYAFKDLRKGADAKAAPPSEVEQKAGGFWGFLRNACEAAGRVVGMVVDSVRQALGGEKPAISVVIVRSTEFPLIFNFKDVNTSAVRSDVGLHLVCRVANINEFYKHLLADRKFVSFDAMQKALSSVVRKVVTSAASAVTPDAFDNNPAFEAEVLAQLKSVVSGVYSFIEVKKIIQLTAQNEAFDNLRRMGEELYVAEQELEQLQRRNDFLNRMQAVKNDREFRETEMANAQELRRLGQETSHDVAMMGTRQEYELQRGRMEADFEANKLKIYQDMELTDDERAKFDMILRAERTLREAKSDDEVEAALHEYKKSGLLREDEINDIESEIFQKVRIRDINHDHALEALILQNEHALEQQRLDWEILMGNKRLDDEIARSRKIDAYNDERRDADDTYRDSRREKDAAFQDSRRDSDAAFQDSRRQSDINFQRAQNDVELDREERERKIAQDYEERDYQIRMAAMRQMQEANRQAENDVRAQELAMKKADQVHAETMQRQLLDAATESQRLDVENQRIYAGMSADQIMAANPNISAEAAEALARKAEAEAAAKSEQSAKTEEMLRQQAAKTEALMREQIAMANQARDEMAGFAKETLQTTMQQMTQQNLKQMEMMRDTAAAFAGQRFQQQQDAQRLHDREVELAHKNEALARQDEELARQRRDADRNQDRMLAGVQSTVAAAGSAFSGRPSTPVAKVKCPKCGAELDVGSRFCIECGSAF